MASIFLSYDREDVARARPVAARLERSGHSVWWDRQIRGGREFAAEIEAALDAADSIVVLWSARAVKSAWVRDEAAVGRDSGRLVPVTLDGTLPPLGFRQFQTIDLSKARGRAGSQQLEQLVEALDTTERKDPSELRARIEPKALSPRLLIGLAAILVLTAATAIGIWLWRAAGTAHEPRIAVIPADSSSLSQQAARDLVLGMPNLPGSDVSAYQVVDGSQASRADAVLTIGASTRGGQEHRGLVLRSLNDAILWSASIDVPSAASASLPRQLAVAAQRALSCAAEALSYRRETIGQDTLRVYLSACTNFDNSFTGGEHSQQYKLFAQVIAQAPHFEPAWAKLLDSELSNIDGSNDRHGLLLATRAHRAQALKLGLDFAELRAAGIVWVPPNDFVRVFGTLDSASGHYPNSAAVYRMRAQQLWRVGRMGDAAALSKVAVQLDPLSSANEALLIIAYAYAGHSQEAFAELRKAEQLFPGAPTLDEARYGIELRYGDPKVALALLQATVDVGQISSQQTAFLTARIDPSPANIERAITEDRLDNQDNPDFISQITQTLAQFGRKDEVIDIMLHYGGGPVAGIEAEVLFRPAFRDVWRDPRSMAAAAHLGMLHYWKVSGNWPDFCSDPTLPYNCKKEAAKYRV